MLSIRKVHHGDNPARSLNLLKYGGAHLHKRALVSMLAGGWTMGDGSSQAL